MYEILKSDHSNESTTVVLCCGAENKQAHRFVFRNKSTPYNKLLKCTGSQKSFRTNRVVKILFTVFKILACDTGSASLYDLIRIKCTPYNLRRTTILDLPRVKSTMYRL